jgi:chromosome segregation ATPase
MDPVQQVQTFLQEQIKMKLEEIKNLNLIKRPLTESIPSIASFLKKKTALERQQQNIEEIIAEFFKELSQINQDLLTNPWKISAENVVLNERRADTLVRLGEQQTKIFHIRKTLLSDEIKYEETSAKIDTIQASRIQLITEIKALEDELKHY